MSNKRAKSARTKPVNKTNDKKETPPKKKKKKKNLFLL